MNCDQDVFNMTSSAQQQTDDETYDGERMYLPAMIFSSELTSQQPLCPKHLRVLSYDGIEELNQKLNDLFYDNISFQDDRGLRCDSLLDENPENEEEGSLGIVYEEDGANDDNDDDDDDDADSDSSSEDDEETNHLKEPILGRIYKMIFSRKSEIAPCCNKADTLPATRKISYFYPFHSQTATTPCPASE